jgi:hypothetical protein
VGGAVRVGVSGGLGWGVLGSIHTDWSHTSWLAGARAAWRLAFMQLPLTLWPQPRSWPCRSCTDGPREAPTFIPRQPQGPSLHKKSFGDVPCTFFKSLPTRPWASTHNPKVLRDALKPNAVQTQPTRLHAKKRRQPQHAPHRQTDTRASAARREGGQRRSDAFRKLQNIA